MVVIDDAGKPEGNAGFPDKIREMIKKRLRLSSRTDAGGGDYFPPKSLLKKLPIASKIPCGWVATPAGVGVGVPPQPQLTFSAPLSSLVTIRAQGAPVTHVPEQSLFAVRTQFDPPAQVQTNVIFPLASTTEVFAHWPPCGQVPTQ